MLDPRLRARELANIRLNNSGYLRTNSPGNTINSPVTTFNIFPGNASEAVKASGGKIGCGI
jgi:hypothetical protein